MGTGKGVEKTVIIGCYKIGCFCSQLSNSKLSYINDRQKRAKQKRIYCILYKKHRENNDRQKRTQQTRIYCMSITTDFSVNASLILLKLVR